MYETQGSAAVGVSMGNYGATKQPSELPLLEYATQEINRLAADIAQEIRNLNGFVDNVRGPVPSLIKGNLVGLGNTSLPQQPPNQSPNRGDALREAIRSLQVVRNDAAEAVSRLSGI